MPTQWLPDRLRLLIALLVAGLAAHPLGAARADGPDEARPPAAKNKSKSKSESQPPAVVHAAVVRGRVTSEAGAPLAGALVRVAVPATDMRFVDAGAERGFVLDYQEHKPHKLLETRADAKGNYRLEVPGIAARTLVSIDAMTPGYRRLVGTLMSGGDARQVEVAPGGEAKADLVLPPALYFAGIVVDEQGKPVPAVAISANVIVNDGQGRARGSGGIEQTVSRADGTFELFNYPEKAGQFAGNLGAGVVHFSHPSYIHHQLEDVYAVAENQRESLRVVLDPGRAITGAVVDAAGKPVPRAMVEAVRKDGSHRKATLTDADGKFALRGLKGGLTMLTARGLDIHQKAQLPMALKVDKLGLEVRLKPMALPVDPPAYSVLGMRLTDVTGELRSAYDLFHDRGALVLDPGKAPGRLEIGEIAEGNVFWIVGKKRVGSVREFVDQLLAETVGQNVEQFSVRVVYGFRSVQGVGNNTQYMKFTRADRRQLQILSGQLSPEPR